MMRVFVYFVYLVCGVLGILGGLIGGFMSLAFLGVAFFEHYEAFSPFENVPVYELSFLARSFLSRRLIGGATLCGSPVIGLVIGLLTPYLLTHKRFPWQTPEQKVGKLTRILFPTLWFVVLVYPPVGVLAIVLLTGFLLTRRK